MINVHSANSITLKMDSVTVRSTGMIPIKWLSKCILKFLTNEEKKLFRTMENHYLKINKTDCDIIFNETCKNNDLLPTFTSVPSLFIFHVKEKAQLSGLVSMFFITSSSAVKRVTNICTHHLHTCYLQFIFNINTTKTR